MLFRKVLNVKNKHSVVESSHYSGYTGTGQRERGRRGKAGAGGTLLSAEARDLT